MIEERSESYGNSLVIASKVVEIDGRFVEVRLLKVDCGDGSLRILPRCKWANRDRKSIKEAYEQGFQDALKETKK